VGNLSFAIDDNDLANVFKNIDGLDSAQVKKNDDGKSKGYGFCNFTSETSRNKAIEKCDGIFVEGRKLNVSIPKNDRTNKNSRHRKKQTD